VAFANTQIRDESTNGTMLNAAGGGNDTIRTGNGTANTNVNSIHGVRITLPTNDLAARTMRLIQFGGKIKDKENATGTPHLQTVTIYHAFYMDTGAANANPGNTFGTLHTDGVNNILQLTHNTSFLDGVAATAAAAYAIDD